MDPMLAPWTLLSGGLVPDGALVPGGRGKYYADKLHQVRMCKLGVEAARVTLWSSLCVCSSQSPHRFSAGGSLLFMRCVSLTLTRLVSAWRRGEHPRQFWLSHCQIVSLSFVWGNSNQGVWTFVKLKKKIHFQTNWISCIPNWGVRCDVVSGAGHTCCCCSFLLCVAIAIPWETLKSPRALVG